MSLEWISEHLLNFLALEHLPPGFGGPWYYSKFHGGHCLQNKDQTPSPDIRAWCLSALTLEATRFTTPPRGPGGHEFSCDVVVSLSASSTKPGVWGRLPVLVIND